MIKQIVKKHFPFVRFLYWKIRCFMSNLLGTKVEEKRWSKRNLKHVKKGFDELNHAHRCLLIEKITAFHPLSGVLEIGSDYGPNLFLLSKEFPKLKLRGIDINPLSVKEGNKWLIQEGILNIKLFTGKTDDLKQFPDKSFDVVFSDATLIYIGPDKIKKTVSEMIRIAKKAIIIVEHHSEKESALGFYNKGNWVRDYRKLFQFFGLEIKTTKISPKIWGGDWGRIGYIIEIII